MSDRPTLPIHPTRRHPLTGAPLEAVWVRPDGRVMWPIIGAAPDDPPPGGDSGGGDGGAGGNGGTGGGDKPPGQNNDTGNTGNTGSTGSTGGEQNKSSGGGEPDKGFPTDKPWQEMTVEQQAAYWRDKAQVHETRNKDLLKITGGKYGDDLKKDLSDLENLRTKNMTESERAVELARKEARTEALREAGERLAAAEFKAAWSHVDGERRDQMIGRLKLSDYLTDDGSVDTDKVQKDAELFAPTAKDAGSQRLDYGAGRRGGSRASGVSAGADLYAARKTTTANS